MITGANSFQAMGLLPKCNFLFSHGDERPLPNVSNAEFGMGNSELNAFTPHSEFGIPHSKQSIGVWDRNSHRLLRWLSTKILSNQRSFFVGACQLVRNHEPVLALPRTRSLGVVERNSFRFFPAVRLARSNGTNGTEKTE